MRSDQNEETGAEPSLPRPLGRQPQLGPFPMERIRRVDRPTNIITDAVARIDMRATAYGLAGRGVYGPAVQKAVRRSLPGKYPLSAAQGDVIDHIATMAPQPVAPQIAPIPLSGGWKPLQPSQNQPSSAESSRRRATSQGLQRPRSPVADYLTGALVYFLKADIVGTGRVPESAYYSHDKQGNPIAPRFRQAVVFLMRKEAGAMAASSGRDWMGDPLSFQAYQHLGMVAETIANYIRRLGWEAEPQYGPSFVNRYSVLLPPLLLAAGLGEVSRAGIILNPYLGLGFKAAAVLTDMPLVADKPIDFGLRSFCQRCKICAHACPSGAISTGDMVMYNGYETWKLDTKRCASFNFTKHAKSNLTGHSASRQRGHLPGGRIVRPLPNKSQQAAARTQLGTETGYAEPAHCIASVL